MRKILLSYFTDKQILYIDYSFRILISALLLFGVFAKLYWPPLYGITKVFEQGELIPIFDKLGFSHDIVPYFSRFIIAVELFLGISILFNNYLKRLVLPLSFIMIFVFSIHLTIQVVLELLGYPADPNCGCFGDLVSMTSLQALIKNIITLLILLLIFLITKDNRRSFSNLVILFFVISTIMFAVLPISSQSKSVTSFISFVENEEFVNSEENKILCFFDAGCEHCEKAARSLDSLSHLVDNFPEIHIIFSDTEKEKIPNFFEFSGREFSYQVIPFANYETDEVDSYMEITFPDYDNPLVILYDGNKQIRLFDGTTKNEFKSEDLVRILENE